MEGGEHHFSLMGWTDQLYQEWCTAVVGMLFEEMA